MIKNIDDLLKIAKTQETMKLAVAAAHDEDVLHAVINANELDIVDPILIGDKSKIKEIAKKHSLNIQGVEIIHMEDLTFIARTAVELVSEGKADFLMKGLIDTSILLKAVLDKDIGLRTDNRLSHVMVYDVKNYHKLILMTDGGMNILPDLDAKKEIIKNGLEVARKLGINPVKVACLAAKEKVNDKMIATVDASKLVELSKNKYFGEDIILEGPLAFDLVVSKEAAKIKGFQSEIAGDVDLVLVPSIEVGNGIGKTITYLADGKSAGVIMGAKAPIVLVSRADSYEDKLHSIALASVIASKK